MFLTELCSITFNAFCHKFFKFVIFRHAGSWRCRCRFSWTWSLFNIQDSDLFKTLVTRFLWQMSVCTRGSAAGTTCDDDDSARTLEILLAVLIVAGLARAATIISPPGHNVPGEIKFWCHFSQHTRWGPIRVPIGLRSQKTVPSDSPSPIHHQGRASYQWDLRVERKIYNFDKTSPGAVCVYRHQTRVFTHLQRQRT